MEYDHPGDVLTTSVGVIFRVKASLIPSMDKIQITLTLKLTTTQGWVVQSGVKLTQDYSEIWIQLWKLERKIQFNFFWLTIWWLDAPKGIEKIIWGNAFKQKKKKSGLKFNRELALISLQTSGPRLSKCPSVFWQYVNKSHFQDNFTWTIIFHWLWHDF